MNTKRTHPDVGASKRAEMGAAALAGTSTPIRDCTTPSVAGQAFRVADFLSHGAENAVPMRHLKDLLHLDRRTVRLMIRKERYPFARIAKPAIFSPVMSASGTCAQNGLGTGPLRLLRWPMRLRRRISRGRQTLIDIFEECRERIPARRMAEGYGYHPNSSGFIPCPFHQGDRTASLKLYPGAKGWHCFGCNRGGSVIDFVAELFNLAPLEAVRKLNDDFRLALPLDRQQTPQERTEAVRSAAQRRELSDTYQLFEQWRENLVRQLNECFRLAHSTMKDVEAPADWDKLTEAQVLAIREQARVEYLSDALTSGEMSDIMAVYRERGLILRLVERILNPMPMSSGAA